MRTVKKTRVWHVLLVLLMLCVLGTEPAFAAGSTFKLKRDNNRFSHFNGKGGGFQGTKNYDMNTTDMNYLYNLCGKNQSFMKNLTKNRYRKWGGSCYGVSTLMALVKNGKLRPGQLTTKKDVYNFYSLPSPCTDPYFLSTIQFYHLTQYLPVKYRSIKNSYKGYISSHKSSDIRSFLQLMIKCGKYCRDQKKALVFSYGYATKNNQRHGHSILCVGYDQSKNEVKLYDLNKRGTLINMRIDLTHNTFFFYTAKGGINKKIMVNEKTFIYMNIRESLKLNKGYLTPQYTKTKASSVSSAQSITAAGELSSGSETLSDSDMNEEDDNSYDDSYDDAADTSYADDSNHYGDDDTYGDVDYDDDDEYYDDDDDDEDSDSYEEWNDDTDTYEDPSYDDADSCIVVDDGLASAPYDDGMDHADSVYINANLDDSFTITSESGQTLIVQYGGVGGTMPIRSLDYVYYNYDDTEIIIETADFNVAEIDIDSDSVDMCLFDEGDYRAVEGDGIDKINLNKEWDMDLSGKDYSFTVFADSYKNTNDSGALLSSVSASASGDVKVDSEPKNLTVTSQVKMTDVKSGVYNDKGSAVQKVSNTTTVNVDASAVNVSTQASSPAVNASKTVVPGNFISVSKINHQDDQIKLSWRSIPGAEGYDIFASFGNEKLPSKPTKTVTGTNAIIKKAYKKSGYSQVTGDRIRYIIKAYKTVDGQKKYFAKSKINQTIGKDNPDYSDAKAVTVKKKSYVLNAGKSAQIKAHVKTITGKNQLPRTSSIRYTSSDKSVATVSKSGKIRAIKAGTCYIHITAVNGLTKDVIVNVN